MLLGLGLSIYSRRRGSPTAPDYEEPVGDDPVAPPAGDPVPPTTTPTDPETDEPEPGFDPDFVNLDRIEIIDGQAAERTTNDPATFGTAYIASEVSAGEYWEFTVNPPTPKNATFAVGVTTLAMPLNGIPGDRATELAWWSDGTVRQNDTTLIDLGAPGRLARGDRGAIAFGPSGEVRLYKNCTALNGGDAVGSLVTAAKVFPFVALFSARTRIDMVFTLAKFGCPVPDGYYPIGQAPEVAAVDVALMTTTGFLYNSEQENNFTDSEGLAAVAADGDRILLTTDISGNGNDGVAPTSNSRPFWRETPSVDYDSSANLRYLNSGFAPEGTSGTLAAKILRKPTAAIGDIISSTELGPRHCTIRVEGSGIVSAQLGSQTGSTIQGGSDITDIPGVVALTWNGTTVRLYWNGTEIYSGAQVGIPDAALPLFIGCRNQRGSPGSGSNFSGEISNAMALDRDLTPTEVSDLATYWNA